MSHPGAAALDALRARCETAPQLAGVRVCDGPPVSGIQEPDVVALGTALVDLVPSAVGQGRRDFGGGRLESFDMACLAQSLSGDVTALPAVRARAYDLVDAVAAVIDADRSLGEVCMDAQVVRVAYRPVIDEKSGVLALIEFTVRVEARRFGG